MPNDPRIPEEDSMMDELIARLGALSWGSRDIDVEIALTTGLIKERDGNVCYGNNHHTCLVLERDYYDNGGVTELPHFTTSLDAALTLIPPGRIWTLGTYADHSGFRASLDNQADSTKAPTAALALCIAALKARSNGKTEAV